MTTPKPIDFKKVEAMRKHMLLTTSDMAELLGISRMTYYGWVKGRPMRKTSEQTLRTTLKKLLHVMTEYGWPMPEILAATQKQRKTRLLELINN